MELRRLDCEGRRNRELEKRGREVYQVKECGEKRWFLSAALLRFSFLSSPAALGYCRGLECDVGGISCRRF